MKEVLNTNYHRSFFTLQVILKHALNELKEAATTIKASSVKFSWFKVAHNQSK
jgi:hypothetical protein